METDKKEIAKLIDSIGNESQHQGIVNNLNEYLQAKNYMEPSDTTSKPKSKCKSGKCGNNTTSFIIVGVLVILIMLAGHGLCNLLENMFK